MDIKTHNGEITIENSKTGEWRTFKIKTQSRDSNFAPGKRIVSLLTGSDNTTSYTSFGFVNDGVIHIWNKKKTKTFYYYKNMLEEPERWEERGYVYQYAGTCRSCNRKLTTPRSIKLGIGPICEKKIFG